MYQENFSSNLSGRISSILPEGTEQKQGSFSIREAFEVAWRTYKSRFLVYWGIILIPTTIIGFIVGPIVILLGAELTRASSGLGFDNSFIFPFFILFFIAFIFLVLLSWIHMSLIYAAQASGEKRGLKICLKAGLLRALPSLWIGLLSYIIISGWTLLLFLFVLKSPIFFWALGYIFILASSALISTWFLFSYYVLAAENLRGTRALARSKELARGCILKIFALIFVLSIIWFFLNYLLSSVPYLETLVLLFLIFLWVPFWITLLSVIYNKLSETKKGEPTANSRRQVAIIIIISLLSMIVFGVVLYKMVSGMFIKSQNMLRELPSIEDSFFEGGQQF